jgi:hypothetical protein
MTSAGGGSRRLSNLSGPQSGIGVGSNRSIKSSKIDEDYYSKKAEGTPSQFMHLRTRQKIIKSAIDHDSGQVDESSHGKDTPSYNLENTDDMPVLSKKRMSRFSKMYERAPQLKRMHTVFEEAEPELKDTLEDAKSTKWRVSQMVLLSKISILITIFSFLCSTVSHSLEYQNRFTPPLSGLLYTQMTASILTLIIRLLFYTTSKLHLIAKKEILPSTPIHHIWPPATLITELALILIHPSPF